jgi:hypothetical protein
LSALPRITVITICRNRLPALRRTVARMLPYQAALSTTKDGVALGLASLTSPLGVASARLADAIGFLST